MATVSLVTLVQHRRLENVEILVDMINEQTYLDKVIEWVIIDGSKEFHPDTKKRIQNLKTSVPIVFLEHEEGARIGRLRNKANRASKGDIIVCLDDDDYYPPTRIQEAYDKLTKSDKLIAGCSDSLMYDFVIDRQFKFESFMPFHSPNNAFAYKREYLKTNSHDETVFNDEEISFTKNFTEPLIQLDVFKTVNVSSHIYNTFNKRQLIAGYYNGQYKKMWEYGHKEGESKYPQIAGESHGRLIPSKYYVRMHAAFMRDAPKESEYDITYVCGQGIPWSPADESLGGSEQAVRYLCQEWAKCGKKVVVYGNILEKDNQIFEGVIYKNWRDFPYHQHHKWVIIWRLNGMYAVDFAHINADKIWWDLHDNMKLTETMKLLGMYKRYNNRIDKIMFKSEFHKTEFETIHPKLSPSQYFIIPNGIRVQKIQNWIEKLSAYEKQKQTARFCYCSSYTRGLANILNCVWPVIVKHIPHAELHLYYGMVHETEETKKTIRNLIGLSKNVMDHGREPLEMVVREKSMASYQLYLTDHPAEIDCINIREGLVCGCVPILSNTGVYAQRDGYHISVPFPTAMTEDAAKKLTMDFNRAGLEIVDLVKRNAAAEFRNEIVNSNLVFDWSEVAKCWLDEVSHVSGAAPSALRFDSQTVSVNSYPENLQVVSENVQVVVQPPPPSEYDITYFGGDCDIWDPNTNNLGGSEQAVKYLSEEWTKMGKKVIVYTNVVGLQPPSRGGQVATPILVNGVTYAHWQDFSFIQKHKILIVWRMCALVPLAHVVQHLNADEIWLDIHDSRGALQYFKPAYDTLRAKITRVMFKSEFNRAEFNEIMGENTQFKIVPNGLRLNMLTSTCPKDKNKFIYASCYTRGLERILTHIFPKIREINDEAVLYVSYGMEYVKDEQFKARMMALIFGTQGVVHMGRIKTEALMKLKSECMFQLYPTTGENEIDCISIREMQALGGIPILSTCGVFKEREGIHVSLNEYNINNPENLHEVGHQIGKISAEMTSEKYSTILKSFSRDTLFDWSECAQRWLE